MTVKSCEKVEKSQVALTIEVNAAEFEAAVEKAYQKMRRKISVPGFRPGKAPRKMIERMYGAEVFFEEAINIAFPEAYEAAAEQEKLQIVGYPTVEMVGEVTKDGFTFKATTPVYPEVTLGEYKGLKAEKPEVKVLAADVDERLKALADRNTRLVSVEREAKSGDTAVIDFEGFKDGVPFEGGKGENFSLELGSGSFVPGFEEQVIGMKAGEEKDIDITFPEDYHKDLAGKAVVFHVKVNEVKEAKAPAVDDEFAKDVSEFETLADFRKDLGDKLLERRKTEAQNAFENAVIEQLVNNMECEVPDGMVETQLDRIMEDYAARLQAQGIGLEDYAKMMGMDINSLRTATKPSALRQVRVELALTAVADAEKLEAAEEDVNAEVAKLAEQYKMEEQQIRDIIPMDALKRDLRLRKASELVVAAAKVGEPEKKDEEPKAE